MKLDKKFQILFNNRPTNQNKVDGAVEICKSYSRNKFTHGFLVGLITALIIILIVNLTY